MSNLIKCPTCNKEISDQAISCPGCGHPLKKTNEKKNDTQAKPADIKVSEKQIKWITLIGIIIIGIFIINFNKGPSDDPSLERVIPASNAQIERIKSALKKGFSASQFFAIKSKDFKRAYFVAAKLKGPGLTGNEVGVWTLTGDPNKPGMMMSVNNWAKNTSVVPDAGRSKAKITMYDDGAMAVKNYVEKQ